MLQMKFQINAPDFQSRQPVDICTTLCVDASAL